MGRRTAFPLRTKNSPQTKNNYLTGKAPYKFESLLLHRRVLLISTSSSVTPLGCPPWWRPRPLIASATTARSHFRSQARVHDENWRRVIRGGAEPGGSER